MRKLFKRAEKQEPEIVRGATMLIHGDFDGRRLVRTIRSDAQATGTVGWARRRSDGSVEVAAYREDGLTDFFNRAQRWAEEPETLTTEITGSSEAEGEQSFRLRREQLVLTSHELDYYSSLSIDTESRWFTPLHTSGLLKGASGGSVETIQRYWEEHWGKQVDTAFHVAFERVTGVFDPRVIPQTEYRPIWKFFNPGEGLISAYSNKVLFSRLVPAGNQPTTRLVCIDGRFYDSDATWLSEPEDIEAIMADMRTGVIKPTDTDNGKGVERIQRTGEGTFRVGDRDFSLDGLTRRYRRNFMVQEVVRQHEAMAEPHADSLNTLRVVTLRLEGVPHHLLTFARFGADGRINDNAGTGGQCVGVQVDGAFNSYGVDEHGRVTTSHPTSGVEYSRLQKVPNYDRVFEFAKSLHAQTPYFDLLSWDMAIDPDGQPVLIECNFRGAVWLYQMATGQSLFGDFTEDVLETVRRNRRT